MREWAAAAASGFVNRYGDTGSSTIAQTQLRGPMMSAVWASEGDYSGCWAGEGQAYGLPKGVCFVDVTEHPSPPMICYSCHSTHPRIQACAPPLPPPPPPPPSSTPPHPHTHMRSIWIPTCAPPRPPSQPFHPLTIVQHCPDQPINSNSYPATTHPRGAGREIPAAAPFQRPGGAHPRHAGLHPAPCR